MILVFFVLVLVIILLSQIKINIEKIKITNKDKRIKINFLIKIGLYLFGKIKIINFRIDENRIKKAKFTQKINKEKIFKELLKSRKKVHLIKMPYKVKEFKLNLDLGTENAALTSYAIGIIGGGVSILLGKIAESYNNKYYYKLTPIYEQKNIINLSFNCIIYLKMVHIIHAIFIIIKRKRSDKKNGRTSNRRPYDYSYG